MVEVLNLRHRTILSIFCVGFVLITWTCPSYAAKLKDIRVGEYETHTRIVFEHGDTIPHEMLHPLASGQLTVVFPDTELDLIRKIPVDRSKRLKEIKIWQRQNELSLVLTFAFAHFRYELSKIDRPKRLVLDVYPMTPLEATSLSESEEKATPAASGNTDENPDAPPQADKPEATPEDNLQTHTLNQTEPASVMNRTVGSGEQQSVLQKSNDMSNQKSSAPAPTVPEETIEAEQAPAQTLDPRRQVRGTEPPPAVRPWRLQHYLAIGLVILTLAILVLLLVMLISKNRWANTGPLIKTDDGFERQNERIAALDAQIQEQLKRYEKV